MNRDPEMLIVESASPPLWTPAPAWIERPAVDRTARRLATLALALVVVLALVVLAGCVSVSAEVSEAAEKHLGHIRALNKLTVPAPGLSPADAAMVDALKKAIEQTAQRLRDLARPK